MARRYGGPGTPPSDNLRVFHDDHEHDPELWGAIHRLEAILDDHEEMGFGLQDLKNIASSVADKGRRAVKAVGDWGKSDEDKFIEVDADRGTVESNGTTFNGARAKRSDLENTFKSAKRQLEANFEPTEVRFNTELSDLKTQFASDKATFTKAMGALETKHSADIAAVNGVIKKIMNDLKTKPASGK